MNSRIYTGTVMHHRHAPIHKRWVHPYYFYALQLDELTALDREIKGFGFNRWQPVSIREKDYQKGNGFSEFIDTDQYDRVLLITMARFLVKSFIPVHFYYCMKDDKPVAIIVEVNNTFDERHIYTLTDVDDYPVTCRQEKHFHVSPFNDMNGYYDITFSAPSDELKIEFKLIRDGQLILTAMMHGDGQELTSASLWSTVSTHLLTAIKTYPRILLHAAILHLKERIPVYKHPEPSSPMTMKVHP